MVDSLLKAAQEQKEETLALRSQLKALEKKIENSSKTRQLLNIQRIREFLLFYQ